MTAPDVVIVGSGPAGVSCAFPLLHAGRRVLMVDAGRLPTMPPPGGHFLQDRRSDPEQWRWMLGPDFHALRMRDATSPKLRAAPQAFTFAGYAEANRVEAIDCIAVGSLAAGGLSNAWGCGVGRFGEQDAGLPFPAAELDASYAAVAQRIGISGRADDDMAAFFGVDAWAQDPLPMNRLQAGLLRRYARHRESLHGRGFRMGRSRVAALSRPLGERGACDLSSNCLYGCSRGALYSAAQDLQALRAHPLFTWQPGVVVDDLARDGGGWAVRGQLEGAPFEVRAPRAVLAAGTLATTAIALRTLGHAGPRRLLTTPTAAFLLWLPLHLGAPAEQGFGLGQLSFTVDLDAASHAFGSLFSTTGLPAAEFARHMPLTRPQAMQAWRHLASSCLVGNVFLPGGHSDAQVQLDGRGRLQVRASSSAQADRAFDHVRRTLARAWPRLGGFVLPGSFTIARPGGDIHYAGTLPMDRNPAPGQTSPTGELHGLPGVYVADGAAMPALPAQSHTLALMAQADRIGRLLAEAGHV